MHFFWSRVVVAFSFGLVLSAVTFSGARTARAQGCALDCEPAPAEIPEPPRAPLPTTHNLLEAGGDVAGYELVETRTAGLIWLGAGVLVFTSLFQTLLTSLLVATEDNADLWWGLLPVAGPLIQVGILGTKDESNAAILVGASILQVGAILMLVLGELLKVEEYRPVTIGSLGAEFVL